MMRIFLWILSVFNLMTIFLAIEKIVRFCCNVTLDQNIEVL